MGLLDLFARPAGQLLLAIPKGTFTVDPAGRIMTSTIPRTFPQDKLQLIGQTIIGIFSQAKSADAALNELTVEFGALKIHARELRGGAMVFLTPIKH